MNKHPEFTNFIEVSSIDVDAGCIWVGDPCYILQGDERPLDFGQTWLDICNRFSERSGYNEYQKLWSAHCRKREDAFFEFIMARARDPAEAERVDKLTDKERSVYIKSLETEFDAQYDEEPFNPPADVDKGFANFTHDEGHGGMGTMINTFYGDGSYPVYIEYGENGRPRRVLIDFDPGAEE